MSNAVESSGTESLSRNGRLLILITAFLGWMGAGIEMSLMVPTTRPAIQDFTARSLAESESAESIDPEEMRTRIETSADQWLSWFIAAFLLGAALGGLVFGWLGDRIGRAKSMGLSILCYSVITAMSYFVTSPEQLLILRFLACMGIGGMWPCGVALVMEALPGMTRAFLAGWIGCSANVGFLILGLVMLQSPITRDSWRWVFLFGGSPAILGLIVLAFVPESPRWLSREDEPTGSSPLQEVFGPKLLKLTLLGIALGTVPLLGGWASGQRLIPWAGQVGEAEGLAQLKAQVQVCWAIGAVLGSLVGGWFASWLGERLSYFLISLLSLGLSGYIFLGLDPTMGAFLPAAFALGLISTMFFGWLPYFLPTLFPLRVRATGTGVAFNFGRIFSVVALLSSTALSAAFAGNIAKMGATTSLIYAVGLVLVWLIPKHSQLDAG
ncbi:MAG: MFS transporter [Planctomycetaceae bacterium]|nr:MFS transporter [Planctomycetaceae bacterium]